MRRPIAVFGWVLFASLLLTPSSAFAQQSLNLYLGGFVPRGEDARVRGDVLVSDLDFFDFDLNKFRSVTAGAEWLVAVGDRAEVGLGLGIFSKSVPSRYSNLVSEIGTDIKQDLKLRVVPMSATFRFLPAGRTGPIQPYIGGGVGVFAWRYTETGDFVDFNNDIFRDRFVASGTEAGPIILGGVRVPVGAWDVGFEVRHQAAKGDVDPIDFAEATKIDLGGFSYLATFNIRF